MATEKEVVSYLATSNGYKIGELVKMPDDGSADSPQVKHICRNGVAFIPRVELTTRYQLSTNKIRNLQCYYWNCMACGKTYYSANKEDIDISNNNKQQQNMYNPNMGQQTNMSQGYPHQNQYPNQQYQQGYPNQQYPNQQYQQQQGYPQQGYPQQGQNYYSQQQNNRQQQPTHQPNQGVWRGY
ncbi:hypothetical protein P4493_04770 [Bacillus thuringiensis]|jgi:hypothetical protein|uniref:Repetitive glutamine-rich protein n=3 Tax=Bacillus thuringiensis TaxID=1428 RepID=A0A0B5NJE6_BACTU|nr:MULTISPECIES: hypothetical protein [Bacillus]EAO56869.1 Repetitive glutamine-rich protein [Bacillus thuringiensis serovar israelensis ATCC 35646]MEC2535854.1 hypothetical protein [Bacillus cereus]MED1153694.1 hypothetical protein [Bacillus paranthracis]OUB09431.1 hypothetical protein BK708_33470 [Bacillus thuringiensis serovar yunnanensis]AFQ30014.1 hypothetical protein BTF1_29567 [Bacillus thuringiensis HD-789]